MRRDRWRVGPLLREATRNTLSGRARLFGLVVLAALLGSSAAAYAGWERVRFERLLVEDAAAGRGALTIAAADPAIPAQIDRASCEALSAAPDVLRAGVVLPGGTHDLAQVGARVTVLQVSGSLLPQLGRVGAVIGPELRPPGPPFALLLDDGTVQRATVGAAQPDAVGTNSAIAVGLPPAVRTARTCTVLLDRFADARAVGERLAAQVRSAGPPLASTTEFEEPRNPVREFLQRPTRFLPLLLGLVGGLAAGLVNRRRTGDWAAYALSGTASRSILLLQALEQLLVAGCFATAAALSALVLRAPLVDPAAVLLQCLAAGALWVLVAAVLSSGPALRRPTDLAKDR